MRSPESLEELENEAMRAIRGSCEGVEWLQSWAVMGGCDYLDVFRARDQETAMKVAHPSSGLSDTPRPRCGASSSGNVSRSSSHQLPGAGGLYKQR